MKVINIDNRAVNNWLIETRKDGLPLIQAIRANSQLIKKGFKDTDYLRRI